jgi:hypothetical protein
MHVGTTNSGNVPPTPAFASSTKQQYLLGKFQREQRSSITFGTMTPP